jgi:hypothetical protein
LFFQKFTAYYNITTRNYYQIVKYKIFNKNKNMKTKNLLKNLHFRNVTTYDNYQKFQLEVIYKNKTYTIIIEYKLPYLMLEGLINKKELTPLRTYQRIVSESNMLFYKFCSEILISFGYRKTTDDDLNCYTREKIKKITNDIIIDMLKNVVMTC